MCRRRRTRHAPARVHGQLQSEGLAGTPGLVVDDQQLAGGAAVDPVGGTAEAQHPAVGQRELDCRVLGAREPEPELGGDRREVVRVADGGVLDEEAVELGADRPLVAVPEHAVAREALRLVVLPDVGRDGVQPGAVGGRPRLGGRGWTGGALQHLGEERVEDLVHQGTADRGARARRSPRAAPGSRRGAPAPSGSRTASLPTPRAGWATRPRRRRPGWARRGPRGCRRSG